MKLSEVLEEDENLRIESEFFLKRYLEINLKLAKHGVKILSEYSEKVSDGTHFTPNYKESGVPFLSAINVKEGYLDLTANYKFISPEAHNELYKRCDPKAGDVLLRKVGVGARWACVIPKDVFEFSIFVSVAQIRSEDSLNPYFLATYINSNLGQLQLLRFNKGSSQPDLHLEEIRKLKVPILDQHFQQEIELIVKKSHAKLEESKAFYAEAANFVLGELGLSHWEPINAPTSIKTFHDFMATGRLDAEHYQPKYDYALEKLKELKPKAIVPLESFLREITNGQTPLHHDLSIGDVVFLTAEHIFDFRINYNSDKRVQTEHHEGQLSKTEVKKGDILITIKGKIGNAAVVEEVPRSTNINQDVGLLRLKEGVNPYFIAGFLNSVIGKMFTEKISTGQINPFLGLGNLRTVPIPLFDNADEIAEKLKQKIIEAETANQKSKHLLETAKRAVEMAIEQDEEIALTWMKTQIDI